MSNVWCGVLHQFPEPPCIAAWHRQGFPGPILGRRDHKDAEVESIGMAFVFGTCPPVIQLVSFIESINS